MAHFRTTVESAASVPAAFDLIVDFAKITTWDPGVVRSSRLDAGPLRVGSRFLVVSAFGPRRIPLEYEITEFDAPNRAVLVARTAEFQSYDVITVMPTELGSAVTYDADLALNGYRRVFDLGLRAAFLIVGKRAESGMRRELDRLGRP